MDFKKKAVVRERADIAKDLVNIIFAYISEDYSIEALEFHRVRLHEVVDEVCGEMIGTIRGLEL